MTFTIGTRLPERSFGPITRTDIVRYQGASGDFNPIHHDDEFARAAGFPTVFSVGMLQAGYLGTYVAELLGADRVRSLRFRFQEQCWPGDLVTCRGTVAAAYLDPESGEHVIELDVEVSRDGGGTAVVGRAVLAPVR